MLRRPGLTVCQIRRVTFKVAVFVALRDACALKNASGAIFHAAIAGDGEFTGAVGAGNQLPSGAAAELAIFEGHRSCRTTEYEGEEETASGGVDDL